MREFHKRNNNKNNFLNFFIKTPTRKRKPQYKSREENPRNEYKGSKIRTGKEFPERVRSLVPVRADSLSGFPI